MVERTVVERTVVERTVVETTSGGKHTSHRKEEGIKVPSSGHFLDNVTILDSSGYFS